MFYCTKCGVVFISPSKEYNGSVIEIDMDEAGKLFPHVCRKCKEPSTPPKK